MSNDPDTESIAMFFYQHNQETNRVCRDLTAAKKNQFFRHETSNKYQFPGTGGTN